MPLPFSSRAFGALAALFINCAAVQADSAGELIKKGDSFDAKLNETEALNIICLRRSWSRRTRGSS